jgi:uncharacterized surface protein with fasciclin (FAS1) repeats
MSDRSSLIDTIANQDKFSTFTRLMASSGANEIFKGEGDFTVFAPSNDAFAKIPDAKMNEFLNETGQTKLKALLSYHILPNKVMAGSLTAAPTRKAFTGEDITFSESNGIKVNGASVQARNLEATNGVIHGLDTVLVPKTTPIAVAAAAASATPSVTPTTVASGGTPATATAAASSALSAVPAAASTTLAASETKPLI